MLTYALLQNATPVPTTATHMDYVSQGDVYSFQHDVSAAVTSVTTAPAVTPIVVESETPESVRRSVLPPNFPPELPAPPVLPDPPASPAPPVLSAPPVSAVPVSEPATTQPLKTSDDTVFLTPLPIITYAKPQPRNVKNYQKPKPSDPNQNQLIKALLAQTTTPGSFIARPQLPKPATQSFIIRASTQHAGKTQIVNVPISATNPISIVRNTGVTARPIITHNLLVKEMTQRYAAAAAAARSAFARTTTGTTHSSPSSPLGATKMAMSTPLTLLPSTTQTTYTISSNIPTTAAPVATSVVSSPAIKPFIFSTTTAQKPRVSSTYPAFTKAYVPVTLGNFAARVLSPDPATTPATLTPYTGPRPPHVGSRIIPDKDTTRMSTAATITLHRAPIAATFMTNPACAAQRATTAFRATPYKSRHLEPGEIPQVRKFPPRTFPGPRTLSAVQRQAATQAQIKAALHAQHHAEAQAQKAIHANHFATSREVLQAKSLLQLQAASHAQLEAALQVQPKAATQVQLKSVSQAQLKAVAQAQPRTTSQIQASSVAQPQIVSHAQFTAALFTKPQTTSTSHLATPPTQIQTALLVQSPKASASQSQSGTTTQPQTTSHAQFHPLAHTHHRLIIRTSAPSVSAAENIIANQVTLQKTAEVLPKTQNESLSNTSLQGNSSVKSLAHSTSTLTLPTGTTLIMPHYKTTVFKNLSTIARAEPGARLITPTTSASSSSTERVVIRRPVAYFAARRSFPTQPTGQNQSTVNVQRHIIRTIPRHVLGTALQDRDPMLSRTAAPSPPIPNVVTTASTELPSFSTLPQNTPQSADKQTQ